MLRLTSLLLAASLTAGCGALARPIEKPQVKVRGLSLGSAGLTEIEGTAVLDVFNPNPVGVPLRSVEWSVSVGGSSAVSGRFDATDTIPAKASAPVLAQIRIDTLSAVAVARKLAAGERHYTISGRMTFTTQLASITVEFSHTGDLEDAARLLGDSR